MLTTRYATRTKKFQNRIAKLEGEAKHISTRAYVGDGR